MMISVLTCRSSWSPSVRLAVEDVDAGRGNRRLLGGHVLWAFWSNSATTWGPGVAHLVDGIYHLYSYLPC